MDDLDALLADLQATTTAHLQGKSNIPLIEHSAPIPLDLDSDWNSNELPVGTKEKRGFTQNHFQSNAQQNQKQVIEVIEDFIPTESNVRALNQNRDSGANSPPPPVPPHPAQEEVEYTEPQIRGEKMASRFGHDTEGSIFPDSENRINKGLAEQRQQQAAHSRDGTDQNANKMASSPPTYAEPVTSSKDADVRRWQGDDDRGLVGGRSIGGGSGGGSVGSGGGGGARSGGGLAGMGMGSSTDIGFLSQSETTDCTASPDSFNSLEGDFEIAAMATSTPEVTAGEQLAAAAMSTTITTTTSQETSKIEKTNRNPADATKQVTREGGGGGGEGEGSGGGGGGGEGGGRGSIGNEGEEDKEDFNYFVAVCSPTPNRKKVIVEPAPDEVYFVTTWHNCQSTMRVGRIIVEREQKVPSPAPPSPPKEIEPEENVVTAMGNAYHVDHFICTHCQKQLGTETFFERDSQPYCEECCHFLFSPRCAYCTDPITGKCMSALNKTWHPEHFFCAQCGTQFGEEEFHEKDEKVFCKKCFFDLFAARCKACNHPITSNYISALDGHWHNECFTCRECLMPFTGGSYFEHEGQPYCEVHYHARRGSLCAGCQTPITGRCITAMGQKFHPEHFVCSFCLNPLKKGTFKEQSEKPYCHACFNKLFG